ncbi:MAG: SDR family oxidoreductase [Pseudomonadota bacterium]
MIDFSGKSVVITGGARGIGYACAEAFSGAGASVVIADLSGAGSAAEKIGGLGVDCDIADGSACAALINTVVEAHGRIDVLVNNAAVIAKGSILDLDPSEFDRVLGVNLRAYFVLTQLAARKMKADGGGAIINMSSLNAVMAIPDQLAYNVAKGGLQQLTRSAALALAPHNIRVNAIGPGSIMTEILKSVMDDEETRTRILSRTPMGRFGDPEEVASIALFLASDMASYMTGETVFADGGRSALNYTVPVGPIGNHGTPGDRGPDGDHGTDG